MEQKPHAAPARNRCSRTQWLLLLAIGIAVALRLAAVYTVAGNWDEFQLFESSSKTAETGVLSSGGRPGLAQLLVLPLVAGCDDEMAVVRSGRVIWVFITLAFLAGLGVLLGQLQPDPKRRLGDAVLGIGLLALTPAFLEWSIQVRTDQIALAGGVWGGVAMLASKRRPLIALAAGMCFGIGFLSSQKLLYTGALMALLVFAQLWFAREVHPRREAIRASLCVLTFALCIALFRAVASQTVEIPSDHAAAAVMSSEIFRGGLDAFDFYRKTIGYSQYREILPSLGPHAILLAGLIAATLIALRRSIRQQRRGETSIPERNRDVLGLAWAVLALGGMVGVFHAGAFFYFWMTLGIFPAVALAVSRQPICDLLSSIGARTRRFAGVCFWLLLAAPGFAEMILLVEDSQKVQRESFDFIHHNFNSEDSGFHPESGLFCRGEGQPIRNYFSRDIYQHFGANRSEANREHLIQQFRDEHIRFLVQSFRLNQFPVEIRRFWADNYQPYRASVFVAGRQLKGSRGDRHSFELIAPGPYRWLPSGGPQAVAVDGRALEAGEVIRLESGVHVAGFPEDVAGGTLVLAVADPPGLAPLAFYKSY